MDTSYLTQQVAAIIAQLHGLFDEIGVPHHERDSRESQLFSALSESLHAHLKKVTNEKNEMTEEAHRLIKTIKQMESSLDDSQRSSDYGRGDDALKVSYPLNRCLQSLKEKYNVISKLHHERFEQIKKLVQALESYASHFEPSFVQIKLPPSSPDATISPTIDLSPSYVTALDNEFTRVYEEYSRRVGVVKTLSEEVIKLWAELGTPQAQIDSAIVEYSRDAPEQLGLHESDLAQLKARRDRLVEEKRGRERKLKELKATVEGLWERLGVEDRDRKAFLASNRGCGLRVINEFEGELNRLNELKRQNLHIFVEEARIKLQELWDALYFSEEEMLEFTAAFQDVYTDALLFEHEAEIQRLEALREQRAPTLQLIDKHRSLIKERDELAASSQDASRLMLRGQKGERRDPTRLLREEKMRKRIAKDLPKIEVELQRTLEAWEEEYGRPFLVHGERYLDELAASSAPGKALPPRSKTPSGLPPRSKTPSGPPSSAVGRSAKPTQPAARLGSSVRGPPPPRSKTPTAMSAVPRTFNPAPSSVSTAGSRSPSKIPARVPLTTSHNKNSPERSKDSGTMRKMPPPRAPPPRMKNLLSPPPPSETEFPQSGTIVRYVSPEDVYDDRAAQPQYGLSSSTMGPPPPQNRQLHHHSQSHHHNPHYSNNSNTLQHHSYPRAPTPPRPSSRQISATSTSTAATAVSGSENWETYDDASEPEDDASAQYYAKLRAAAARGKRQTPDGGYPSPRGGAAKKARGLGIGMGAGAGAAREIVEIDGRVVRMNGHGTVEGSDAGWTDEDAF